jgi:hypothetical protein
VRGVLCRLLLALGVLAGAAPAVAQTSAPTPREETPEDYPAGAGRDETFYFCTGCHGFKLVAAQGQSRRQWDETLDFMTARHGMPKPEGEDRKILLDYLEASFPPRAPSRGYENPFLKR